MRSATAHPHSYRSPNWNSIGARRGLDLIWNALVLALLWAGYAAVRSLTEGAFVTAAQNANSLLNVQNSLGFPSEAAVQNMLLDHTQFIRASNLYYVVVHFPLTVAFLAWAWHQHRDKFSRIRNALVVTTSVGLFVHLLYPLLPPRMMHGFVDTAKTIGPDPYELGISAGANQFAAMPSLHVGWALLVAVSVIWLSSSPLRWLVLAHPIITFVVVVVTANHYWADALIAMAIVAVAWRATRAAPRATLALGNERDSGSRSGNTDTTAIANRDGAVALSEDVRQLAVAGQR